MCSEETALYRTVESVMVEENVLWKVCVENVQF